MLADAPDLDLLSELLKGVRLTGSVFLNGRFSAPFGVISPARWRPDEPAGHLRHVSVFHLIAQGGCHMQLPDGREVDLTAGDLVLIPFTPEHRFWAGAHDGPFAEADDIVSPGPASGLAVINHGGGGEVTRLVCGFLESAELAPTPLFRTLPTVLVEKTSEDPVLAATATSIAAMVDRLETETQPGAPLVLGRMMELLFVEVLRRHANRLPKGEKGVLAASRDPLIARALAAIHRDAAHPWTVESLAREAGASRTVLSERFGALLGQPPMDYLGSWRMQLAGDLLRTTKKPLIDVAEAVGYASVAAFSRAFSRTVGVSPGAWRDGGGTV
jgi:AraC-like DNA-binding protein